MIKVRCPICDQPMQGQSTREWPQFPFCSPRCRTIDLGRWLGETYRMAPEHEEDPWAESEESETP
jgi:endogenous inhibitor of DNA gyrase (YacG/DUF329 family)